MTVRGQWFRGLRRAFSRWPRIAREWSLRPHSGGGRAMPLPATEGECPQTNAMPRVVYLTPTCRPYGGIRITFQHAEGLRERGYRVTVVGPDPPPDWYPCQITYLQAPLDQQGVIPVADICIGTFWNTVEPAYRSVARHVFHLCQGFEGVHREYASILSQIDAAYRLPIPKVLISSHLEPVLTQRYGCRCYFLGQAVDSTVFTPGEFRATATPLRV